jgi:hypothetical protein
MKADKLIEKFNSEVNDAWLCGRNIREWLHNDERNYYRRAARRYLRSGKLTEWQAKRMLNIIETTA